MKRTGSQIITTLLEMEGIKVVAGIPGGSILPLYDELNKSSIHHVLVRQEQAAGFIAQGIARTTGLPAVCMATSGPGAMNLLTSIADARCDSVPIIAITGQVNTSLIGTDAFQEADTFGLSFPITKHSIAVKKPEELLTAIPEAFKIAMDGRRGPVLIDVPRDVQCAECEFDEWPDLQKYIPEEKDVRFHTTRDEQAKLLDSTVNSILESKKPVLYVGGGANNIDSSKAIKDFLKLCPMPVVSSLMGIGCIASEDELYAGMVGMHGSYSANRAMYESDLVIVCGARFDDRATGVVNKFCPDAKIIHIDIDAAEINKIIEAKISFVATVQSVLPELCIQLKDKKDDNAKAKARWLKQIAELKEKNFSLTLGSPDREKKNKDFMDSVNPRDFIRSVPELAEKAGTKKEDLIIATDVGQHQMWVAQYYPVLKPMTLLTSGSLGTMGFGLPAAIGSAIANPDKRTICFSGDGSIMMNIQELATLSENNLPVTVIVFENGTLGMVYQQQKFLFDKNYSASIFDTRVDLLKIAEGFGIETADALTDKDWYKKAFDANRKNKPFFVRVKVDPEEEVLPYVPGGRANVDSIR